MLSSMMAIASDFLYTGPLNLLKIEVCMDTKRLPSCIFRTRDDGIHEFTFLKSERAAVDQYITHLTHLFASPKRQDRVKILIDLRESGALPLPYLFQRSREFIANTPNLSATQMAIVYGGGLMTSVTDAFFRHCGWMFCGYAGLLMRIIRGRCSGY